MVKSVKTAWSKIEIKEGNKKFLQTTNWEQILETQGLILRFQDDHKIGTN